MTESLVTLTATEMKRRLDAKEISARELTDAHLDRIDAVDGPDGVNAFLQVTHDRARAQADAIDKARAAGQDVGALGGVPVAIKDVIVTKDIETTAGSKILQGWQPPYDATVVERIDAAGGVMLGKTNMDEFAMGSSNENSAYGPVQNPWDTTRVPGGSSGGSAAAVAGFMAPLALGTDTGGSIRQPAALCGIVGAKPTWGAVSRYGLIAFASSLDQAGVFARTTRDTAMLQQVIAGHDPRDATSMEHAGRDLMGSIGGGLDGLRVGVISELKGGEGFEPGVEAAFTQALATLEEGGAKLDDVSLPHAPYGLAAYYLIAPSEASSNLARFDGVRFGLRVDAPSTAEMMAQTRAQGFGAEVKRRIMIGTHALSSGYYDAYYAQASKVRTLIRKDFADAFAQYDVLVSPTTPNVAFPMGDKTADPVQMYLNDIATVPGSLAGVPGISVPMGMSAADDGTSLPVGLQIMAPLDADEVMFRAAAAFEARLGFDATPTGDRALSAPAR